MSFGPNRRRGRAAMVLAAVAILTTGIAATSFWVQRTMTGEKTLSGKVLPDFSADMPQIRTLTLATNGGVYNLVRKGDVWVIPERGDYPVSPQALSALAKGLSDLSYKTARTSDPAQFARLGVDDPSPDHEGVLLSIKNTSGQILDSLHIGQKADALFVRRAGSNDVFEADGSLPNLTNPIAWLNLKVLDVTPETIASVSGQRAGEARYDIVRRPDGGFAPVGGIANVTATTAAIAITKWAPIDVMPASNLASNPIATHTTSLRSGVSISLAAYRERDRNWIVVSASSDTPTNEADVNKINRACDGWAFAISDTDFADVTFARPAIQSGPDDPSGN
jgi:hypothetical protein